MMPLKDMTEVIQVGSRWRRRRRRRRMQLLYDFRNRIIYWELKAGAEGRKIGNDNYQSIIRKK